MKTADLTLIGNTRITDVKSGKTTEVNIYLNSPYLSTMCSVMLDMEANYIELLKGLLVMVATEVKDK